MIFKVIVLILALTFAVAGVTLSMFSSKISRKEENERREAQSDNPSNRMAKRLGDARRSPSCH